MIRARRPALRNAPPRARVAAWLRAERGETLIEVVMATLLVALIAAAILRGYMGTAHIVGTQRQRAQATTLAQQDQARMRGLTITQLAGSAGNGSSPLSGQTLDGTTYTITSSAQYISGTSGGNSCTTGPTTTSADEVAIASKVTWPGAQTPVIIHGLVAPSAGGSLVVTATNAAGTGLAGVTASLSGPTTVSPLTTDANGCAIFGGLSGGSYTVSFAPPSGYIDESGNNPPAPQTATVTPTQTATVQVGPLALPGSIQASFTTNYTGTTIAATGDTFIAANTQIPAPGYVLAGTDSTSSSNTFASSVTASNLFPFAGTNSSYVVYAGNCTADLPPSGQQVSATVTAGSTTNVTLPEPAMIVDVWSGSSSSPGSLISSKPHVVVTDTGCGNNKDYPPTQVQTSSAAGALANPGLPYGNYSVCADNGSYYDTATVSNTNFGKPGNVVNLYLGPGGWVRNGWSWTYVQGASAGTCS